MPRKPPPCSVPGCPEPLRAAVAVPHTSVRRMHCGRHQGRARTGVGGRTSSAATCMRTRGAGCAPSRRPWLTTSPTRAVRWWRACPIRTRGTCSVRCVRRATTARPRSISRADGQPNVFAPVCPSPDQGDPRPVPQKNGTEAKNSGGSFDRRGHQAGSFEEVTGGMILQEGSNAAVHGLNPFVRPSGLETGVILQREGPRLARRLKVS